MSSLRLAAAFLLLFLAGYIVGSSPRHALYTSVSEFALRIWKTGISRAIITSVCGLTVIYLCLVLVVEKAAALEQKRTQGHSIEIITATEYLRRRGSF